MLKNSEPTQTSMIELFTKIFNSSFIFAKTFILDVLLGSEYACVNNSQRHVWDPVKHL